MDSVKLANLLVSSILTAIGFVGNGILVFVFTRNKFIEVTMFRLLTVTSIWNFFYIFMLWPFNFPDFFQINVNVSICKLVIYFGYIFYSFSPWLVLLCSFDRVLIVVYPTKFKFRNKFKFQFIVTFLLLFIVCLLNIPFGYFSDLNGSLNDTYCGYTETLYLISIKIDLYLSILFFFLPFFLMILCTAVISFTLIKKRTIRNAEQHEKDKQFIITLFSLDLFYFICNLPYIVYILSYDAFDLVYFNTTGYIIFNHFFTIHISFNVFVNFFSNKLFRNYIFNIGSQNNNRIHPI